MARDRPQVAEGRQHLAGLHILLDLIFADALRLRDHYDNPKIQAIH